MVDLETLSSVSLKENRSLKMKGIIKELFSFGVQMKNQVEDKLTK